MAFDIYQPVFDQDGEYLEDAAMRYREQLMELFDTRKRLDINVNGLLVEKIAHNIQTLINTWARKYWYIASMETSYEVKSKETLTEYLVNLKLHTCSCKLWQSNGYPCGHALTICKGCALMVTAVSI